jgi:hypothetical protein
MNVTIANNVFVASGASPSPLMLEVRDWQATLVPPSSTTQPNGSDVSCAAAAAASAAPPASVDVGAVGRHEDGSCPVFPPTHPMNSRVDSLPVHPMSTTWLASIGTGGHLHPDFGGSAVLPTGQTVPYGIPITTVTAGPGRPPRVPISYTLYPDESDPPGGQGAFPIPPNAAIEGSVVGCSPSVCGGDRHLILFDAANCTVAEFWQAAPVNPAGSSWTASNGAVFNLTSNRMRPAGWTSADAAGLSIYAGLIKYAEVAAGAITHAIRMTVANPQLAYVQGLATHYAGYLKDPSLPPMGLRLRIKAAFNCSSQGYSREATVICVGLQQYGAIISDIGSSWYLTGEASPLWNSAAIADVSRIPSAAFEAVYSGPLCLTPDCRPGRLPAALPLFSAVADLSQLRMGGNVYHVASPQFLPRVRVRRRVIV